MENEPEIAEMIDIHPLALHICKLKIIEKHHNQYRPHQGIDNMIPDGFDCPEEPCLREDVVCHPELGGILNHYSIDKVA